MAHFISVLISILLCFIMQQSGFINTWQEFLKEGISEPWKMITVN